jgi:putative aminopeptidase FrvX
LKVEVASIGTNMRDIHTPDENVSIPSVANFWMLLRGILEKVSWRRLLATPPHAFSRGPGLPVPGD